MQHVDEMQLKVFKKLCDDNRYFNVSYPEDADFDCSVLKDFLDYSLNNCGNHEKYSNYVLNSFDFENEVINYFVNLFKGSQEEIYGYVTNGGTEGNMWGLYIARKVFPEGIVYYSKDAHYSAQKSMDILKMANVGIEISKSEDGQPDGEMNYADLAEKVDKSKPVIIFATIGSVTRGAVDNVATIRKALNTIGVSDEDIYIHADQALSGSILPFVDDPQPHSFTDGIDSLAVSGHKGFGSPIPCGIALAKKIHVQKIAHDIPYIKAPDDTISGSRNGLTPLILWYRVKSEDQGKLRERVHYKLRLAEFVVKLFEENGIKAWRHKNSITVVAPIPSEPFIHRHKLAPFEDKYIHIITTAHNSKTSLDWLIQDMILDYKITDGLKGLNKLLQG